MGNIFRIEDPVSGLGPYNNYGKPRIVSRLTSDQVFIFEDLFRGDQEEVSLNKHTEKWIDTHPFHDNLDKLCPFKSLFFGFLSITQLKSWFPDLQLFCLHESGTYQLAIYTVKEFLAVDPFQVMFSKPTSSPKWEDLSNLYD